MDLTDNKAFDGYASRYGWAYDNGGKYLDQCWDWYSGRIPGVVLMRQPPTKIAIVRYDGLNPTELWSGQVATDQDFDRAMAAIGRFDYILKSRTVRLSVEQAEAKHMVRDRRLGKKPVPFGFQNAKWLELLSRIQSEDELWEYSEYVGPLRAEWGIAVIRNGAVIGHLVTGRS